MTECSYQSFQEMMSTPSAQTATPYTHTHTRAHKVAHMQKHTHAHAHTRTHGHVSRSKPFFDFVSTADVHEVNLPVLETDSFGAGSQGHLDVLRTCTRARAHTHTLTTCHTRQRGRGAACRQTHQRISKIPAGQRWLLVNES